MAHGLGLPSTAVAGGVSQASVPGAVVGVVEVQARRVGVPHGLAAVVAGLAVVAPEVFECRSSSLLVLRSVPALRGAGPPCGHDLRSHDAWVTSSGQLSGCAPQPVQAHIRRAIPPTPEVYGRMLMACAARSSPD